MVDEIREAFPEVGAAESQFKKAALNLAVAVLRSLCNYVMEEAEAGFPSFREQEWTPEEAQLRDQMLH